MSMIVRINGEDREILAGTLAALLREAGINVESRGLAVAVNMAVVPRGAWATTELEPGDRIEIVRPFSGG